MAGCGNDNDASSGIEGSVAATSSANDDERGEDGGSADPLAPHKLIPTLDLIEARGDIDGTEQVTLHFTADLPDIPVVFVDQLEDHRPGAVSYTTQNSADGWVGVCGSSHSFPEPGNRTVDVFLPSEWFSEGAARDDDKVEIDAGDQVAKIIECLPRDGVVQISIWGAATADPNEIAVSLGEGTITIDIGTPHDGS